MTTPPSLTCRGVSGCSTSKLDLILPHWEWRPTAITIALTSQSHSAIKQDESRKQSTSGDFLTTSTSGVEGNKYRRCGEGSLLIFEQNTKFN